jgi:myosin tail region-interacting protein MTI1
MREASAPSQHSEVQLSPEELMSIWSRVGVRISEAATTLHDKSKKTLVGDGSFSGFVLAVLTEVPNAHHPTADSYGYLIYAQSGAAVQRRVSEILPGDVIVLSDAKLKGHKGLQSYQQHVGAGEMVVGIVTDWDAKKSKVKVLQANQHVGQQVRYLLA